MTALTFQKIPTKIKAVQFDGMNSTEILDAFEEVGSYDGISEVTEESGELVLNLTTIHGDIAPARASDWVVPEPEHGRFYPIKAGVFADTYLPIVGEVKHEVLAVQWPRIVDGTPITKTQLKEAWTNIIKPVQEAGQNNDPDWKVLMAVFRSVYGIMPDEE